MPTTLRLSLASAAIFCFSLLMMQSCTDEPMSPRPRGYFRIALPEKEYRRLDSIYPYTFDYPVYCDITNDKRSLNEVNWINLDFTNLRGRVHLSYKSIENIDMLNRYAEDARTLAFKHIPKASSIEQIRISYPEHKVYGLIYNIRGPGAASPYQFYLTDSTHHYMRGALYFNAVPNSDSLMPVIDFVKKDIDHLISSLAWK